MKVGDLVQYRGRLSSDPEVLDVKEHLRGWDKTGIVISIGVWSREGKYYPGEGITYMESSGNITEAHIEDLKIIGL